MPKHRNLGIWDVRKKSEFWKILAQKINADFRIITTASRDLNRLELKFEYEKVTVTFGESDTKPLFVECNFNRDMGSTSFEISKVDFIEKLTSNFSKRIIHSTNRDFDKKYSTKTTDNNRIRRIINNKEITELILRQNLTFIGGKQEKNGKFNLVLNVHRNIISIKQLETIYKLTTTMIDSLNRIKTTAVEDS